jgi:putative hydrolase of the HAD superfamily
MRKPEPRIFHHTCSLLGVAPAGALFLDDMQANVNAAESIGMTSLLVSDAPAAIDAVRALVFG